MTEDDTFRVLKKVPYEVLKSAWARDFGNKRLKDLKQEECEEFVDRYGWTLDEVLDYGRND